MKNGLFFWGGGGIWLSEQSLYWKKYNFNVYEFQRKMSSCFRNKTQGQMFLLASGRHVGASQMDTNISPNISKMKNCTDLNLGDSPCIFNSSYFPNSGLIFAGVPAKTGN